MSDKARIQNTEDEGLFSILHAAGKAAAGPHNDPVGVLEILPDDGGTAVAIEAAYAIQDGRRIVHRLDVRTHAALDPEATLALAQDGLARFGSTRFTNFCLAAPGGAELVDVTTYFPTRFGFYARNVALVSDAGPAVRELLDALGVRWSARGQTLHVPARQLRAALAIGQQIDALRCAIAAGLSVTLYASELPATQAVRLQQSGDDVDCCLSRGLRGTRACTLHDAEEMEALLARHFGVKFRGRRWKVDNAHGEAEELYERGVVGQKSGIQWPSRRH